MQGVLRAPSGVQSNLGGSSISVRCGTSRARLTPMAQAAATQQQASAVQFVRKHLLDCPPYTPIEPFEVLSARFGRTPEQIVKLDANENPYGPPPEVRQALAEMPWPHIYPDPETRRLRKALSELSGVPEEHLLVSCCCCMRAGGGCGCMQSHRHRPCDPDVLGIASVPHGARMAARGRPQHAGPQQAVDATRCGACLCCCCFCASPPRNERSTPAQTAQPCTRRNAARSAAARTSS